MKLFAAFAFLLVVFAAQAEENDTIVLKNEFVQRVLKKDGDVWRTVRFARADGTDAIEVQSDEFHILPMGSEKGWTINDYEVDRQGRATDYLSTLTSDGSRGYVFYYRPRAGLPSHAPARIAVYYELGAGSLIRKKINLELNDPNDAKKENPAIDRLQIERFSTTIPASRGGRGEPVFCGNWFFGLEYPASWNQHSSRQQPRPYDKLGNFSFITLDGREKEFEARAGLITLAHFPGKAAAIRIEKRSKDEGFTVFGIEYWISGKTAVIGIGKKGDTPELAFLDYLNTIRRPVRSFIHYNNWYDQTGKNLKPENFVDKIAHTFKTKMEPYGVKVDAFVPDNGWQNRNSIWQPNPHHFPEGMKSFAELGAALKKDGTSLGLWFTLNGYELNTDWGIKNGYFEAQRNPHFSRFNRYYALGDPKYNAELRKQLSALIKDGQMNYIKHDFNDMCDMGPHNGSLPDDRHGHEKAVDETLSILAMEREINPDIFQNVTNWAWFSPWWLQHCNTIWMLSDDTGANRKWPALSDWQMAITYRDAHLFKAWGDPATRPLVPISHLMTHGIVNASHSDGPMSDPIQDWSDYVLMYYARGVQLKEWYITPSKMDDAHWKVLGELSKWAQDNSKTLANAVYIGGTPEKGEPYGYVSWNGDHAIIVVRNPDIKEQTITIPFDQSVWYRGEKGKWFNTKTLYEGYSLRPFFRTYKSGEAIHLTLPGWTTFGFQMDPGDMFVKQMAPPEALKASTIKQTPASTSFELNCMSADPNVSLPSALELILITRGGELPSVAVDGQPRQPRVAGNGAGWKTAAYQLEAKPDPIKIEIGGVSGGVFSSASGETNVWLRANRNPKHGPAETDNVGWIQTTELFPATHFQAASAPRAITADQLKSITAAKLRIELFGSDGGQYANKKVVINGEPVLTLPANKHGDNWEELALELPVEMLKQIALNNKIHVTNPGSDKFKFRNLALAVKLADGTWAASNTDAHAHCYEKTWAHFEGIPFTAKGESEEIELRLDGGKGKE